MSASFRHQEVFPLIARLVTSLAAATDKLVTHGQIVDAVLSDSAGASLVAEAVAHSKWETDRRAASNMVAWFSQQITAGTSPWVGFFERERTGATWAYRSAIAASAAFAADVDASAVETDVRLYLHLRRERSRALRKSKLEAARSLHGSASCECCGVTTASIIPSLIGDILEVHHRALLDDLPDGVPTCLEDLAVLCPNCHRAIHRTSPLQTVEEFRQQLAQHSSAGSSAPSS